MHWHRQKREYAIAETDADLNNPVPQQQVGLTQLTAYIMGE